MEPIKKTMRVSEANDLLYIAFQFGLEQCAILTLQSLQDLFKLGTDYSHYARFGTPKLDTYKTLSEFFNIGGGESTLFHLSFGGFDFLADAKNRANDIRHDETRARDKILKLFQNAIKVGSQHPAASQVQPVDNSGNDTTFTHNAYQEDSQNIKLAPGVCACAGSDEHYPNCHFFMRERLQGHIDKHALRGPDYFTVKAYQSSTPIACMEMLKGLLCQSPIRCDKCARMRQQLDKTWSSICKPQPGLTVAQKMFLQQRWSSFGLGGGFDDSAAVSSLEDI